MRQYGASVFLVVGRHLGNAILLVVLLVTCGSVCIGARLAQSMWRNQPSCQVVLPGIDQSQIHVASVVQLPAGARDGRLEETPGTVLPATQPASGASLPSETTVIGVSVQGRHRAYVLSAMLSPATHIVNDLLGDIPITVTYCDKSNCIRAYTDSSRNQPLQIGTGGWLAWRADEVSMLLLVGGILYRQDTLQPLTKKKTATPFPYTESECVRTTWQEWLAAYPDTDVFIDTKGSITSR